MSKAASWYAESTYKRCSALVEGLLNYKFDTNYEHDASSWRWFPGGYDYYMIINTNIPQDKIKNVERMLQAFLNLGGNTWVITLTNVESKTHG